MTSSSMNAHWMHSHTTNLQVFPVIINIISAQIESIVQAEQ